MPHHLRRLRPAALTGLQLAVQLAAVAFPGALAAEPFVEVTPAMTEKGEVMRVRASIQIDASPASVWAVLSDCGLAPAIIPHLESCRILERGGAGRWDVREHVINPPLLPKMRIVVRNDFVAARSLTFRLVSGDMKASDGAWMLARRGGQTLLSYDAHVAPNFTAPQFLVTRSIRNDFPQMLRAIDRASRGLAPSGGL